MRNKKGHLESTGSPDTDPVTLLAIPGEDDFKGYVTEADLVGIAKRDVPMLLEISVLNQWIDWQTSVLITQNRQIRNLQSTVAACQAEISLAKDAQKDYRKDLNLGKWVLMTVGAGIVAALCKLLIEKL